MRRNSKIRLQRLTEESVIISALARFSKWIYALLAKGLFGRFFSLYSVENGLFDKRTFASVFRDADRADAAKQKKRTFSHAMERSRVLGLPAKVNEVLLAAPFNAHGMFWLLFGTVTLLCYYIQKKLSGSAEIANAVVAVVAFAFSVPMLAVNISFKKILQGSVFFSWFSKPLGIRFSADEEDDNINYHVIAGTLAVIAGTATYWITAPRFIVAVLLLYIAVTLINRPEWGVCLSAIILPWIWVFRFDELVVLFPAALSLLGFLGKWIQGRRAFRWELIDAAVGTLFVFCLISAMISCGNAGALRTGLYTVLALTVYFMIVNLLRVREWLLRLKRVLLFSAAISGVYDFVIVLVGTGENGMKPATGDWVSSIGMCFIVMILQAVSEWMKAPTTGGRLYYGCICVALLLGLSTSANFLTIQILFLGGCLFLLLFSSKTLETLIVLSCPLAAVVVWFRALIYDDSVGQWDGLKVKLTTQHLTMSNMTDYRNNVRSGVLSMMKRYWLCGIGMGQSSFTATYPQYAQQGLAGAISAHNTYLQTWVELGLPGLFMLITVTVLFLQVMFGYLKAFPDGQSRLDMMGCLSGLAVLLIAGFGVSLFSDVSIVFFIVLVMSYAVATADSDARERRAVMSVFNSSNKNADIVFSLLD